MLLPWRWYSLVIVLRAISDELIDMLGWMSCITADTALDGAFTWLFGVTF